jgi:hypothetical protein
MMILKRRRAYAYHSSKSDATARDASDQSSVLRRGDLGEVDRYCSNQSTDHNA